MSVERSAPKGAVFLSYASQDAEAARRICEALRSAGVEVWFDQSELRGGDAWDQKIRKQIKECALFVPIISANTQARTEGYFRLEWRLADRRTELMGKSKAFLLPICIDDTRDADADVPDSFTSVQWTRLARGEPTPGFSSRVRNLLALEDGKGSLPAVAGGEGRIPPLKSISEAHFDSPERQGRGARAIEKGPVDVADKRRLPKWAWATFAIATAAVLAVIMFRPDQPAPVLTSGPQTKTPTSKRQSQPAPPAAQPPTEFAPANSAAKSVAVLAFANLSDDRENEYFSDGISEELLNVLAKVPGLRVAARTSAFYFKGKNATAQEIGQKLGVAHLVEGSVQRDGANVRVRARLSRAETGEQLWSDKFEGELKNIFALQDKIAGRIAENLKLKLGGVARVAKPVNPEAHRLYLEGRHFWNQRSEEGFARAEAALQQAVRIDPQFARGHAAQADLWAIRSWYESVSSDASGLLARAEAAAHRALELDPDLVELHATFGLLRLLAGRAEEAQAQIEQCLALAPNYATARNWHGDVMLMKGRLDFAIEDFLAAAGFDPLSPIMLFDCAKALLQARRPADALAYAERAFALVPDSIQANIDRARALFDLGRTAEATAAVQAISARLDSAKAQRIRVAGVVYDLRRTGHDAAAAALAEDAMRTETPRSGNRGFLLASLGRFDAALPLLAQAPPTTVQDMFWSAYFDPIRDDPRFQELMVKLGRAEEYKTARETLARMLKEQAAKK